MNPQLTYMIAQQRIADLQRIERTCAARKRGARRAAQSAPPEEEASVGGRGVG